MTRRSPAVPLASLVLAAVLAACGGASEGSGAVTPTGDGTRTVPSPTPRDVDPALADVVDLAVTELADRLGVAEDAIAVRSAEGVSWGDTSLGCPQPGMRYAQVVTEGTRIVLEHDGTTYAFHSGGDRPDPFLCEDPGEPVGSDATPPTPGKGLITDPAY